MGLGIEYKLGDTPLDEDEMAGLKIPSISTVGELDEFEQKNIEDALLWVKKKKPAKDEILTEDFIKQLHKKMYGDVWKWAGQFRKSNKNIGVDKHQIGIELKKLLDDCKYWIDNNVYTADEIAIRFKHKIVWIHCFPNGNGRHSRLMADIIAEYIFDRPPFSWKGGNLSKANDEKAIYIKALKKADGQVIDDLVAFARA
jgi:Fic-DOC domain mobile mystery protein B